MKTFLLLISTFVISLNSFAQMEGTKADTTKTLPTTQSLADDRAKKFLPQYAPLSPNAASLQKFGDYQVNLATGIPSIPIPIYAINEGNLSVPISLSFHTSGFKINEQASWVGLGVALDFGPSLNRIVQGLKDDKDGGSYFSNPITASRDFCTSTTDFNYGKAAVLNQIDTQPDIYSYSLTANSSTSKSGKFLLGQNGGLPFRIPDYPVQISYSGTPTISSFELVNDDGVAYSFGGSTSTTESQNVVSGANTQTYISSWLVSQIRSANSDDAINYSYQDGGSQYFSENQWVSSMLVNAVPQSGGHFENSTSSTPTYTVVSTTITQSNPYKITFSNGEIEFVQSTVGERLDLPNSHFLKQINIYNYENGTKKLIKVVKFTYSYFTHNGVNKRLKLDKVSFEDALGILTEQYIPEYWSNTISWDEVTDNEKKDFFGYYNGKPNTHLIPVSSYNSIPIIGGAADRSTVDTYMKDGVLKRLTVPTGGYTEFDYETNKYFDGTTNVFAGGLRVKTIKSVTGTNEIMKRYEYSSSAGLGIGRLTTSWTPNNATLPFSQFLRYDDQNGTPQSFGTATQLSFTQSGGAVELNTMDAAPVYYTTVNEYFEDLTDPVKNGKNVYTFDFAEDFIVNSPTYQTRAVKPWKRGNLISKTTYNSSNQIVSETGNQYLELKTDTKIAGAVIGVPNVYNGFQNGNCSTGFDSNYPEMVYNPVNYQTGISLLGSSTTTIDNVASTKTITYNSKLYIDQTQSDDSKTGDFLTEVYKYPFDASYSSDPIALQLVARNQLNPILENEIQETISGVSNTIYKEKKVFGSFTGTNARGLTNNILPAEIWVAPTGTTLEKRVENTAYDTQGNPTEYKVDGISNTIIWGYNNNLVVGIAKNATLSQTNVALTSSGLNPAVYNTTALTSGQLTTLNTFRNALPSAQVTWFTHIPHIGESSVIAPNGLISSFEYDTFQRLRAAKDHDGNLVSTNFYKISPTENYIQSAKMRVATADDITAGFYWNSQINIQLFDGLGRPTQALGYAQSPDFKTIVNNEIKYDKYGRTIRNTLPVSAGILTANQVSNPKTLGQTFYSDTAPNDSTIFEASPLNRAKETFGPGEAWRTADKKTQIFYESAGSDIRYYAVNNANSVILNGTYPANSLFKKRIIDEQGNTKIEITDKRGRLVQSQIQKDNAGNWLTTYYCYDGLGRRRAVLQPEAFKLNQSINATDQAHDSFVFAYEYDSRGRLIRQDIPGAGEVYSVYDKDDRLVMQKNALQSEIGNWNFWQYDAFGREVMRGETGAIGNTQSYWQNLFNQQTQINEAWDYNAHYYNGVSFPSATAIDYPNVKQYQIYDDYDFASIEHAFKPDSAYHQRYTNAKGLLTLTVKRDLALLDQGQFRYYIDTYYYDKKNRPIQAFSTHDMGGANNNTKYKLKNIEYNFAGEVVNSREWVQSNALPDVTIKGQSTYNHVGLLTNFYHAINGTPVEVFRYTFDPINRPIQKKVMPNGNYLAGGVQDYIFRNTIPLSPLSEEAKKAICLLPGTYIGDSNIPYSATINLNASGGTNISGLQTIDYSHHIRGMLKGINLDVSGNETPNTTQGDLFAYKLEYETAGFYDGNIGSQKWHDGQNQRNYNYTYDPSKRLKTATFTGVGGENYSLPNITYDDNGNILNLERNGKNGSSFGTIDNLSYYYSGNRLNGVTDAVNANQNVGDFRDNGSNSDYTYYPNGSLKSDANKGISLIEYNTYLNKVKQVTWSDGRWLKFYYDGSGSLIKKENSAGEYWHYVGDMIYKNGGFYSINIPEGRAVFSNNNWNYEFDYRDVWGNLRVSFAAENGALILKQKSDYDALGYIFNQTSGVNKNYFQYQKQQRIEDFDLNIDFFKFRPSDYQIGRFWQIDPLSSQFPHNSPYALQENKFGMGVELEGKELGSFYRGVMDAVFEDSAPVATQYVKNNGNSSYNSGAKVGHYLSMALGGLQIGIGLGGDALAGTAEVSTAGLATPAAIPLATGSTALMVNGGATIVKAAANLNSEGKTNSGRGSNHLKPDPEAQGAHSTFRTDPKTGKTTNTATYEQNPKNPSGFQETKRVDVTGKSHKNSQTKEEIPTPHVKEPGVKNPRPANKDEIPNQ